jgi:hypothetical protein
MHDAAKPTKTRTFEAGAHSLQGVHLKAIDDQDLDRILGRGKIAAQNRPAMPLTRDVVMKLIELLKEL